MLGRTSSGHQVVIRNDLLSNRPGIGVYNDLQGTDGCYLSPRFPGEPHRIWLTSRSTTPTWENLDDIAGDVLPEPWRNAVADGPAGAHDGLMIADFVDAVREVAPTPLGIDEAMDLTLPGLVSQASIANGGAWPFHNMHLHAGLANGGLVEYHYPAVEACRAVYRDLPEPKDGWLALPDKPGLGIEPDPDALREIAKRPTARGRGKG